jgi:hypothetical protein
VRSAKPSPSFSVRGSSGSRDLKNIAMNFELTPEQLTLQKAAIEFARRELNGNIIEGDAHQMFSHDGWKKYAAFGVQVMPIPTEYGGREADPVTTIAVMEGLGMAAPIKDCYSPSMLTCEPIPSQYSNTARWTKRGNILRGYATEVSSAPMGLANPRLAPMFFRMQTSARQETCFATLHKNCGLAKPATCYPSRVMAFPALQLGRGKTCAQFVQPG